jgi:hypothetical protein
MPRHIPRRLFFSTTFFSISCALVVLVSCASAPRCPTSTVAAERERWEDSLRKAKYVELRPSAPISIKSDVHELFVGVDAATFAKAFHEVMRSPDRRFGLIRVDRMKDNVGKPFHVGERFQGRYELAAAGRQALPTLWQQLFEPVLADKGVQESLCRIENGHTSDYGEIVELNLEQPKSGKYTMQYRYLTPSPIAGSSTFEVSDVTDPDELKGLGVPKATRVRQIFVYQEQNESFARFFATGGLKLHNQVVYSQVMQAAEAAGACVIRSDIPKEYAAEL